MVCLQCGLIKGKHAFTAGVKQMPTVTPEGDEFSSYGTGDSEDDGAFDIRTNLAGDPSSETEGDIKRFIAAVGATQKAIVVKLAALEKLVTSVQEDVTWVRGDVAAVHDIVDNLADHVSMFKSTVAVVEGLPNQRSPEVSAWGPWKGKEFASSREITDYRGHAQDDMDQFGDEEPSDVNAVHEQQTAIAETQLFDMNTTMPAIRTSQGEEGGEEGWFSNLERSRGGQSLVGKQIGFTEEEESVDLGSHQMEMTLHCTQTGPEVPGASTWSNYTTTVKSMAAPTVGGGDNSPNWARSKRARGSGHGDGPGDNANMRAEEEAQRGGLNLNMSPGRPGANEDLMGIPWNAAVPGRGAGSRGGRGGGRVKRPMAVQPRYFSTASDMKLPLVLPCWFMVYVCIASLCMLQFVIW